MRPEEVRGLGDLLAHAASGLTKQIRVMHDGIARRTFDALGIASAPVQAIHDVMADRAYAAAGGATRSLVRGAAAAIGASQPPASPALEERRPGRLVLGALNGAFGDKLTETHNPLALSMSVRHGKRDVRLDAAGLREAFPLATSRLVVFVHGLCETDEAWNLGGTRHVPYGYRLQAELGYTPVFVRFNSGLHISENGRQLSRLLDRLVAGWPVELHEIALIGHSMGGLVARSACHYGSEEAWPLKVRHVFTLGTPHRGAPLEQAANAASAALARLPETRMLATALNLRSVGIKDLRYGYLVDDDWTGIDCDAFLRRTASEIPFPPTANHYFVCATLSRSADAPAARIIGDLLVLRASAWSHEGRGQRMRFPIDRYHHVGGATHFDLLNHPAIYAQIRRWLMSRKALPAPRPHSQAAADPITAGAQRP